MGFKGSKRIAITNDSHLLIVVGEPAQAIRRRVEGEGRHLSIGGNLQFRLTCRMDEVAGRYRGSGEPGFTTSQNRSTVGEPSTDSVNARIWA